MRLKKTETKRVNESADTIETIEELNSFLSDLIDHDVDVTSKDGAFGIHNPSFGYTSMTMKARNENGKWTIECLVPDINAIDWSDYVDDAVTYIERWGDLDIPVIKKHGLDSSDETLILNGMSEVLTDYYLQHVGEDTETLRFFTLPISKRELKDLITDEIQDMENNLEDFIFNEFFEEVKDRLEGGDEDTEESFRRTHRRIESRRMRNRRVNEAYTSFTRWANAIERQSSRLDWRVATPKYKHPSCVWNGDIYCKFTDRSQDPWKNYIAGVSDSPDGEQVAVYVFEGYEAPYKEVMNDIVLRSQIENAINKNKDKIPEELLKEMVGMFRMFKLK